MAKEFSDANFKADVLESDKLTIVDFWAEWCGPCRLIGPVVEDLANEYEGKATIGKLNVDDNREIAAQYGIMSIPTLLLFKDGKVVDQVVGFQPKEALAELIKKHA